MYICTLKTFLTMSGKILTFYLERESCDLRSQTGSMFDITWHLQLPVTPELCGRTCIIHHRAQLDQCGIVVVVLSTAVVYFMHYVCGVRLNKTGQ